ncbi:hypothetical protein IL306_002544 [Fusarium sp. DS 682]|nr:hypothetical protein IL306_002544 [Fusarium sp. DS 682]
MDQSLIETINGLPHLYLLHILSAAAAKARRLCKAAPSSKMWPWTLWQPAAERNRTDAPARERHFPEGFVFLSNPAGAVIDFVFIHEITESRDEAWKSILDPTDPWPKSLLRERFPRARIAIFGYDAAGIKALGDFLDPERLKRCAGKLLSKYPLCQAPASFTSSSQRQAIRQAEQRVTPLETEESTDEAATGDGLAVDIDHPVVFVAHGFGGVIYEQAWHRTRQ